MLYTILFYLFAAATAVSAILVVTLNNLVRSAFSLLFTLLGVAAVYLLLGADFIAGTQVLIYVGGVLILILFGVMLTRKAFHVELFAGRLQIALSFIFSAAIFAALLHVIWSTEWKTGPALTPPSPTTHAIGKDLLNSYVLPFEVVSVVLLLVLVGAVFMVRREISGEGGGEGK